MIISCPYDTFAQSLYIYFVQLYLYWGIFKYGVWGLFALLLLVVVVLCKMESLTIIQVHLSPDFVSRIELSPSPGCVSHCFLCKLEVPPGIYPLIFQALPPVKHLIIFFLLSFIPDVCFDLRRNPSFKEKS